ncbi:LysR family transcriptional regulator [Rhodophyticola sp. CCM32]|nr:LysR family transcriptional regulator [Rhodophyticola sp. CCM32]
MTKTPPPPLDDSLQDRLARRGLKLTHLRLIAALGHAGQVSAAAARLNMAQPAASRLLTQLEQIFGAALYTRHSRGIELTGFGKRLARRADQILRDLDDIDREISEMGQGVRGRVHIGAVTGPALEIVLPVIRQMRVTHPMIEVTITVDTSPKLVDGVLDGTIDFFLGRILGGVDATHFREIVIDVEPVTLIVRTGHPLTRERKISLEHCMEYDWILQTKEGLLAQTVERYFARTGMSVPKRILRTSSLLMTLALISQSNAIAPVAASVADFYARGDGMRHAITRLPVARDLAVSEYSLIHPRAREMSPASQAFYTAIERQIRSRTPGTRKPAGAGAAS